VTDRSTTSRRAAAIRRESRAGGSPPLRRRRKRLQAAQADAAATAAAIVELDSELASNAGQRRNYEAGLRDARDHVAALKTTIKATNRERDKLRAARKDARRNAAKAARRAANADAKYDRAVLADMVRREKVTDLSTHSDAAAGEMNGEDPSDDPQQSSTTTRPRSESTR
jgi:chromosome segregation ATPase